MRKLISLSTMCRKSNGVMLCIALALIFGCGSAKMKITEYDTAGNVTAVNEVSYTALGSRKLSGVDVNIKDGNAKIGSSEASAGDLAGALLNLSEIAKKGAGLP